MLLVRPSPEEPKVDDGEKLVLKPSEGMSVKRLEEFLEEIATQPPWRRAADKEADYYDGNQLSAEDHEEYEDRGIAPLISNLVKPTIDVVLGMEAKTRSDWMVRPEDGELSGDLAEVLNARLHKAEVASRADRACSDAYADAIKVGLGWVEVSKNSDLFGPPQRVRRVHRREIYFDWRSTEPDMSDARFLVRKRWLDEDTAVGAFPEHKAIIRNALNGQAQWDTANMDGSISLELVNAAEIHRGFTVEQYEWLNTQRRRIAAYEVWYRVVVKGHVLRLPNGRVVEFDLKNDDHVAAVYNGFLMPEPAIFKKVRLAMWLGPHKVSDVPSPYAHNLFPYIPVWGYREDRTGAPYGLIRGMISPQDEINARRSKMYWLLNSRRVIADSDAVLDHEEVADEVGRPDAYIKLNPARRPESRFEVEDGGQLAAQQFQVLEAAKQELQQVTGVYQSMLGAQSNAASGLAINSLIEQGVTTLAEINDNYRFARRLIGEQLLELVREEIARQGPQLVTVGEDEEQRQIPVNAPGQDELGRPTVINDVRQANVTLVIDDAPTSPTVRLQQLQALTEMIKSAPPQVQGAIYDLVVDAMDLPNKREIIKRIRGMDPNQAMVAQAQQAIGQLQQQLADKDRELGVKEREVGVKEAELAVKAAAAQVDPVQIQQIVGQAIAPLVEQIAALIANPGAAPQSTPIGGPNGN